MATISLKQHTYAISWMRSPYQSVQEDGRINILGAVNFITY
jgi:hypothetical protein